MCSFSALLLATYEWYLFFCHLSIFPSFSLPPFSHTGFVTIFFVWLPNQSFSFFPKLISPSFIVDAILQFALTISSSSILLRLLLFFPPPLYHSYLTYSAFHCNSLQIGLLCSVLLLSNLCRVVEHCLDWMWLELLSILRCRIGAMHKILCWQPPV